MHSMAKYSARDILFGKSFSGGNSSDNDMVIIRLRLTRNGRDHKRDNLDNIYTPSFRLYDTIL